MQFESHLPVSVEGVDWGYDWTAVEIGIFLLVVFMIACAVGMICCSSQRSMGFYVSLPAKRYTRWEEGELSEDEEEEDVFPLGELKKNLRVSRTTETMLEIDCNFFFNCINKSNFRSLRVRPIRLIVKTFI
ncbi:hypothetical protein WR25_14199 isoform B [Diploscapter pachys]|uniref:Uncharacterized protein n=1 Tax=Diploscapter pachys TaxID=2018661 RepID=A0A2A2LZ32_9BILA|nr:hypothetical protein WR25_14199 isoform B [Diploscapter pachys]